MNEVCALIGEIKVLKISFEFEGERLEIYPVVLDDGCASGERILVDCGYPGFLPLLEEAAAKRGFSFGSLTAVIVTHHDYDHVGALAEIRDKYPHIRAMASEGEAPYVGGEKKSLRLIQAEEMYDSLSEEEKEDARAFEALLASVRPAPVDETVKDGDTFPWCGGAEIVATPGHLPGHISIYMRAHKTLITGDALVAAEGRLHIANPHYAIDIAEARRSARKLAKLDVERVICCHGGVVEGRIKGRLR